MNDKPKIMITFNEGGENGGPYNSHKRIMESSLKEKYEFIPLIIPKGHKGVFNLKLLIKLTKDILMVKPNIVHFAGLQLEGFYVILACKLAGVKNTVLAIHGSSLEAIDFPSWKKKIVNILEIITLKLCRICYGVSNYVCNWKRVKKYANWCYGHIYNIPNVRNNDMFFDKSFREEMGVSQNDILIVSTGRITREKGFEVLLTVIKTMNIPENVKFVIAGDGDYLDTFKKEIKENKLAESVFLLGYRSDIDRILSESDIFVLCTFHETLCNSIIEACYHSLPVVATNTGGITEIVINNYNGFLLSKNDVDSVVSKLEQLIKDKELRTIMGKRGKKRVDTIFNIDVITKKIDKMYRSLLK